MTAPYGGPHSSLSSTATESAGAVSSSAAIPARSANSAVSAATAVTGSWVVGSPAAAMISWSRPGDIPAMASATVGPRPVGDGCAGLGVSSSRAVRTSRSRSSGPHTSACARSSATARGSSAATAGSPASPPISAPSVSYGHGSGATASASAVCSTNRSSRSTARTTEARVPARVASWVTSPGTGLSRSGRARSSPMSPRSVRVLSSSARVRGVPVIRPTLAGRGRTGERAATTAEVGPPRVRGNPLSPPPAASGPAAGRGGTVEAVTSGRRRGFRGDRERSARL